MYLQDKGWERDYYREALRERRKEILDEAIGEEGLSPENELRQQLLEKRYGKKIDKGQSVDYFIRAFMTLRYLDGSNSKRFFRKKQLREIEGIKSDLQFALAEPYGELGQKVLYQEFCNLSRVYINLCRTDRNYSSVILGIGKMKEGTLSSKIAKDLFTVTTDVPFQMGVADEFALLSDAAEQVVRELLPDVSEQYSRWRASL